jgi:hypothetical protein
MAFTFKLEHPDDTPAEPPAPEIGSSELGDRRSDSDESGEASAGRGRPASCERS